MLNSFFSFTAAKVAIILQKSKTGHRDGSFVPFSPLGDVVKAQTPEVVG